MERIDFLKSCQQCSAGENVVVWCDGTAYRPRAYQLSFDAKGRAIHTAVLESMQAKSCIVNCALENVKEAKV